MTTAETTIVHFKWFDNCCRIVRRFSISFQKDCAIECYNTLIERLAKFGYSADRSLLWWIDSEGDHVLLDDAEALSEALRSSSSKKMVTLISYGTQEKVQALSMQTDLFSRDGGRRRRSRRPCYGTRSRSRSRSQSCGRHACRYSRSRSRRSTSSNSSNSSSSRSNSGRSSSSFSSGSDFSVIHKRNKKMKKWKKHWKKMGRRYPWQQGSDNGFMRMGWQYQDFQRTPASHQQHPQETSKEPAGRQTVEPESYHTQASPSLPFCSYLRPTFPGYHPCDPYFGPYQGADLGFHFSPYHGSPQHPGWDPRYSHYDVRRFMSSSDFDPRHGKFWPPYPFSESHPGRNHHHYHHRHHFSSPPPSHGHGARRGSRGSRESSSKKLHKLEKKMDRMSMIAGDQEQKD